jgi:hypothetical protein
MSTLVSAPPVPSMANASRCRIGSSGGIGVLFRFGTGPSSATGFPARAMVMRSPRSALATNRDRPVFAAWTLTTTSPMSVRLAKCRGLRQAMRGDQIKIRHQATGDRTNLISRPLLVMNRLAAEAEGADSRRSVSGCSSSVNFDGGFDVQMPEVLVAGSVDDGSASL